MPRPIHIGILGLGKIARYFIEDLSHLPDAKFYALASRSPQKARAWQQQYGADHAVVGYEALVALPELDLVYIATPHTAHYDNALLCLEAGISVLCEKPLGMSVAEVSTMLDAAEQHGVYLMEALWTKFLPHYRAATAALRQGAIGEVHRIEADFGFAAPFDASGRIYNPTLGGGSLMDVGLYPVFAVLDYWGRPDYISATAQRGPTGVDHRMHITLQYQDGRTAELYSAIDEQTPTTATYHSTQGRRMVINSRFHEPSSYSIIAASGEMDTHRYEVDARGYRYETEAVIADLNAGRIENAEMTHDFSLMLAEVLQEIREAAGLETVSAV